MEWLIIKIICDNFSSIHIPNYLYYQNLTLPDKPVKSPSYTVRMIYIDIITMHDIGTQETPELLKPCDLIFCQIIFINPNQVNINSCSKALSVVSDPTVSSSQHLILHCFMLFSPKLLPSSGCSLKSGDKKFSEKLIWTRLLKFTKIIQTARTKYRTHLSKAKVISKVIILPVSTWNMYNILPSLTSLLKEDLLQARTLLVALHM